MGGFLGRYAAKDGMKDDYEEGYSKDDIVKRAGIRGAAAGAVGGALTGLAAGKLKRGIRVPLKSVAIGNAALGTIAGYLGARKGAEASVNKTEK